MNQFDLFLDSVMVPVNERVFCSPWNLCPVRARDGFWDECVEAAWMDAPEQLPHGGHWSSGFDDFGNTRTYFVHGWSGVLR